MKLFIGGLIIGGLIFILGTFLILDVITTPNFNKSEFPDDIVAAGISPNGEVEIYTHQKTIL